MKKTAAVAALALTVIALGTPPVLGRIAGQLMTARVEQLDDNRFVAVELLSLEQGWFSSTADIEIAVEPAYAARLEAAGGAANDRRLVIRVDLWHGPLLTRGGPGIGLANVRARPARSQAPGALQAGPDVPHLLELRGRTGLGGTFDFVLEAPPFEATDAATRIDFSGTRIAGTVDGSRVRYEGRVDALHLASARAEASIEGLTFAGDNLILPQLPQLGPTTLAVERLQIGSAGGTRIEVLGSVVSNAFALDDGGRRLGIDASYRADSLTVPGEVQAEALQLDVSARDLDVAALQAYARAARPSLDPGAPIAIADAARREAFTALLAASPSLSIAPLRFRTVESEQFDAGIHLAVDGDAAAQNGGIDPENRAMWSSLLTATAQANVPKPLAERLVAEVIAAQLAATQPGFADPSLEAIASQQAVLALVLLVRQGWLVDAGDVYRISVEIGDRTLTVNGHPLPFGTLPGL